MVDTYGNSLSNPSSAEVRGFTLIEISIVLVIIGLIVGGVVVGRDLIKAAEVRATITQVEKMNQAVNTFRTKYNALPGDLNAQTASAFGFTPRGTGPGQGDGDGVIRGLAFSTSIDCGFCEAGGETAMFWVDLTTANGLNVNLVEGSFNAASPTTNPTSPQTGSAINLWLPAAKIGGGNYFYVWSGGPTVTYSSGETNSNGQNYFGLSAVTELSDGGGHAWALYSSAGLTVKQASSIDSKIDDGLPQYGNVTAYYLNAAQGNSFSPIWSGTGGYNSNTTSGLFTLAISPSPTSCFDNGGVNYAFQNYSVKQNGGAGVNCGLSFRFQ